MTIVLANNAHSTLSANISSTDTVLYITDTDSFPSLGVDEYFYATIESVTGTFEIVKVTQVNTGSFNVVRAQEDTIAIPFNIGARVEQRITVQSLEDKFEDEVLEHISDAAYGTGWNGDTTNAPSKNAVYDELASINSDTATLDSRLGVVEVIVADGDKGDITLSSSGATWTIDNDVVTYDKFQNLAAQYRLLGRASSGSGNVEEITSSADVFSLLGSASKSAIRTSIDLGSMALQDSNNVNITGGSVTGVTGIREKLTGNRDYFVNHNTGGTATGADGLGGTTTYSAGNDSNSGLSVSAPKATLAGAMAAVRVLDLNDYRVRIFVARNSNITEFFAVWGDLYGQRKDEDFQIIGDETTPANCHIQTSAPCINILEGARCRVSGFKVSSSGAEGIKIYTFARGDIGVTDFGVCATYQLQTATLGWMIRSGNWRRMGNAAGWLLTEVMANADLGAFDTFTDAGVTYSDYIISTGENSCLGIHSATWSGSTPTGQAYLNANGSAIIPRSMLAGLPGTVAGEDILSGNKLDIYNGSSATNRSRITTNAAAARTLTLPDASGTVALTTDVSAVISDTAYNASSWDSVTTVAPSKNAVRDKIETLALQATTVSGGGLATGGGDLSANRTITVTAASDSEARAQTSTTTVITPSNLAAKARFSAHKNGSGQSGVADSTFTKVTFGTEAFDVGSYFDTTNSRWTPPAGGIRLSAAVYATTGAGTSGLVLCAFYKNNALFKQFIFSADTTKVAGFATAIDNANGTDYYEVFFYGPAATTYTIEGNAANTFFMGEQI